MRSLRHLVYAGAIILMLVMAFIHTAPVLAHSETHVNQAHVNQAHINQAHINQTHVNQARVNQARVNQARVNQARVNQARVNQNASVACVGSVMDIVAHEDDDLLFLSTDLISSLQAGWCIRTVYVTAGDAGNGQTYWTARQSGVLAADAEMAGVADSWTQVDAGVTGHPMPLYTLTGQPNLSVIFMHLPDGNVDGSGFPLDGSESLQKLWTGSITTIDAIDGSSSYTASSLTSTLLTLMTSFQPQIIRTQDYVGSFGDGDHSDHHTTAYFARAAHKQYTLPHIFTGYEDYNSVFMPPDITGAGLTAKQNAFYAYAYYDSAIGCDSVSTCAGSVWDMWLQRQYVVGSETVGLPQGVNVANAATVTASSQNTGTGQTAIKAVDGVVDGYPGDYTKEWATNGEGVGSWLKLAWSAPVTLTQVVLYDRPNPDDQVTAATLQFSDGTTISVGALPNDGMPLTVAFPAKTTSSLQLTITQVSPTTLNVGLAEIRTWAS